MMEKIEQQCIICSKTKEQVPLLKFDFKNTHFWICSQHIPVIIHDPSQLAGLLPDADQIVAG